MADTTSYTQCTHPNSDMYQCALLSNVKFCVEDFFQILWPSQNIRTLTAWKMTTNREPYFWHKNGTKVHKKRSGIYSNLQDTRKFHICMILAQFWWRKNMILLSKWRCHQLCVGDKPYFWHGLFSLKNGDKTPQKKSLVSRYSSSQTTHCLTYLLVPKL